MGRKILWIEDDYYHLMGLVRPLKKMDFEIEIAESYNEAMDRLKEWANYELIILDLLLPNLEDVDFKEDLEPWYYGRMLFYHMKKLKVNKPILIVSIVQHKDLINELLREGASMHLEKIDLAPNQMTEAINSLLQKF